MRRRLLVLVLAAVLALGAAVAIWAALPSGGDEEACEPTTVTVQDTATPRMMEYRRDCDGRVPGEAG